MSDEICTLAEFREVMKSFYKDETRAAVEALKDEDLLNAKMEEDLMMDSLDVVEFSMLMEKETSRVVSDGKLDLYLPSYDGSVRRYLELFSKASCK